jgi:hypothetical protein
VQLESSSQYYADADPDADQRHCSHPDEHLEHSRSH